MSENNKLKAADFVPQDFSEAALIGSNLIPIIGVLFWDWSVFNILLMYWMENVIVGIMTVFKMFAWGWMKQTFFALVPTVPFFCVHYGLFTMGHGAIIMELFGKDRPPFTSSTGATEGLMFWLDFLSETYRLDVRTMALSALALFGSHFISFVRNFIGRREYESVKDIRNIMFSPYGRIVALHVVVLLGGFAAQATGQAVWALVMLCLFKIAGDLFAHRKAHKSAAVV